MRILQVISSKSRWSWVSVALLLTFSPALAQADSVSDVLTVFDTGKFSMTVPLNDSSEPFGKAMILYPAQAFDLTNPGKTQLSDILSISAITVSLISDADPGGPEPPTETPLAPVVITVTAASDVGVGGVSDILTVTGQKPKMIMEAGEPAEVTISVPAQSFLFGDGGDTLTISAFTANLVSLNDAAGVDAGTTTDTITIMATSDSAVPEPPTLVLVALGLSCIGAARWLRWRGAKGSM